MSEDLQEFIKIPPERFWRELEEMERAGYDPSVIYDVADGEKIIYPDGYLEWQHGYTYRVAEETGEDAYSLLEAIRDRERLEKLNIKLKG